MGISTLTKSWSTIPNNARALPGHWMTPRHAFIPNQGGQLTDIVRNVVATLGGTQGATVWSPSMCRGYAGTAREHSATTDFDVLGLDTVLLPTTECTIVCGLQRVGSGATNASCWAVESTTVGQFCQAYIPFTDGVVYWDFGGETNGSTRVQIGGLTMGDDIWVMTVGPREMATYQNGIVRVSSAINPTRSQGTTSFQLGRAKAGSITSDLTKYRFLFIYHRQLRVDEILYITTSPFCWVDPRS